MCFKTCRMGLCHLEDDQRKNSGSHSRNATLQMHSTLKVILRHICYMQELWSQRNSRSWVIHACNNKTTWLCNPFLSNSSVTHDHRNEHTLNNGGAVFSMVFCAATISRHISSTTEAVCSVWSVLRSYLEDNGCYSSVEGSVVEC
jgi:hypothetical protein